MYAQSLSTLDPLHLEMAVQGMQEAIKKLESNQDSILLRLKVVESIVRRQNKEPANTTEQLNSTWVVSSTPHGSPPQFSPEDGQFSPSPSPLPSPFSPNDDCHNISSGDGFQFRSHVWQDQPSSAYTETMPSAPFDSPQDYSTQPLYSSQPIHHPFPPTGSHHQQHSTMLSPQQYPSGVQANYMYHMQQYSSQPSFHSYSSYPSQSTPQSSHQSYPPQHQRYPPQPTRQSYPPQPTHQAFPAQPQLPSHYQQPAPLSSQPSGGQPPRCLPVKTRKAATTLSSSAIAYNKLSDPDSVIAKYKTYHAVSKAPTLAIKLASQAYFGDDILKRCTVYGFREQPALPVKELNDLKQKVFSIFPQFWANPVEFEGTWGLCTEAIGQSCKRLRKE